MCIMHCSFEHVTEIWSQSPFLCFLWLLEVAQLCGKMATLKVRKTDEPPCQPQSPLFELKIQVELHVWVSTVNCCGTAFDLNLNNYVIKMKKTR